MRDRFIAYAQRYLITSWVIIWITAASVAGPLFYDSPSLVRLFTALGFMCGSVLGNTLFVPLVIRERMIAFGAVISAGIFAIFLMGCGFLWLYLSDPDTEPTMVSAIFYAFMLPGSIIWFSGGAYLAISRWFPEMRDIRLSMRPWRK